MAVLAGCDSGSSNPCPVGAYANDPSQQAVPLKAHVHANGLQLSAAETCQVRTTPVGFVIVSSINDHLRYPFQVSVELLETQPQATGHRVRYLGSGRILWYSATHPEESGMGGPEWEMIAFEHVGNRWIRYREDKQDEWEPDELWDIAQGLRYLPSP